ncbi:MAG: transcriptional regulator PpsR [Bordetella sp.]
MGHNEQSKGKGLSGLDAEESAALVTAAADITLVIDAQGIIRQVITGSADWQPNRAQDWVGKKWAEVVTSESRPKIEEMVREAQEGKAEGRWRHINQLSQPDEEIPILFSLLRVGKDGQMVAVGRDLRPVASLQARLVEAQQLMERDYVRLRGVEGQFRMLFDLVHDPVLLISARSHQVIEANRSGGQYLQKDRQAIIGEAIEAFLSDRANSALHNTLQQVASSGRPAEVSLRFVKHQASARVLVSYLRQESDTVFMLRIDSEKPHPGEDVALLEAMRQFSDGLVLTDTKGIIRSVNPAFVEMIQMVHAGQVIGEPLNHWLGRANTDLLVMINSLSQGGSVRLFSTQLIGHAGLVVPVEISGVSVQSDDQPFLAFVIRDVGRRLEGRLDQASRPRSNQDLTGLVGRMPLREIVGETVDLIEKLCIEAALKITKNNRASAADMLGLSRQSLYVKLRRYGIEGPDTDEE